MSEVKVWAKDFAVLLAVIGVFLALIFAAGVGTGLLIGTAEAWKGTSRVGHFADISQFQPPSVLSWGKYAKEQPFVIMRASYGGGADDYDRAFPTHFKRAKRAGVEVIGAYHFAYPTTRPCGGVTCDARDEAANFVKRMRAGGMEAKGRASKLRRRHEVYVLDYELMTSSSVNDDAWVWAFKNEFEDRTDGAKLWLYGYGSPLNQLSGPFGMPVWFAAYVNDWRPFWPAGWVDPSVSNGRPFGWQHTNGQDGPTPHRLPGLSVNHDVSKALQGATLKQLRQLAS